MKRLMCSIESIFCSKRGELLIETIVSLLVLSIFLLTVTTVFNISLRMTVSSVKRAAEVQNEIINPAILAEYDDPLLDGVYVVFKDKESGIVLARHKIKRLIPPGGEIGITAFDPFE